MIDGRIPSLKVTVMGPQSDIPRPKTPPHQPNAGVTMSHEEMKAIVNSGFPQSKLTNVSAVPTSDSFNNRIYFLGVLHADKTAEEMVLKINGRYFGPAKVQNEVGCLRLLERYCPRVPSPRVLAWSEDGQTATFTTPYKMGQEDVGAARQSGDHKHGGWVMTTKVPGVPVSIASLDDESCRNLGRQMADMVADWRHNIPAQALCGNIKLCHYGKDTDSPRIQGIVMDNLEPSEPLPTVNAYQKVRLADKTRELATTDTYARNRHLVPILQNLLNHHLPDMTLAEKQSDLFVFTHHDLAPRNMLVSGQPLQITGIVDFEFAGFFSPMQEFLNDCIDNRADWPAPLYAAYQERLEANGIATPIRSMDQEIWNRNYWLEMVVNYVAPWWLPGDDEGEGLLNELRKAEAVVLSSLENTLKRRGEQTPVPVYGDLARD